MMRIIYGMKNLEKKIQPSAVTVGVFDGVHTGHKKVISELVRISKKRSLLPVVVTFDPHPDSVIVKNRHIPMLCSLNHRLNIFSSMGIKICIVLKFDYYIASKPCIFFIKDILAKKMSMKALVLGERFSFGIDKIKTIKKLKVLTGKLDINLYSIAAKRYRSRIISSSSIRKLIEKGNLQTASRLLGRPVSVLGTVIHGQKRGRIIGFKTANIDPHHEATPPSGVYAAYTKLGNKTYKSVVNIGRRPTFLGKDPSIEVHIFGINKSIYGKDIEVFFVKRLRPERRFNDEDKLRSQIKKDALRAEKMLYKL
jgi:riboflavin kinase / FMN adenylyltransferase